MEQTKRLQWDDIEIVTEQKPHFTHRNLGMSQCLLVGSNIVVIGPLGRSGLQGHTTALFDLRSCRWTWVTDESADAPYMVGHTMCLVEDSIYTFGGRSRLGIHANVYKFDLALCEWRRIARSQETPAERLWSSGEYLEHIREFLCFGGKGRLSCFNDLWGLLMDSATWVKRRPNGNPPCSRYAAASCIVGKKVFLYGGKGTGRNEICNDLYVLECGASRFHWSELPKST